MCVCVCVCVTTIAGATRTLRAQLRGGTTTSRDRLGNVILLLARSLYIFSIDNENVLSTKVSLFVRFLVIGNEDTPFTKVSELRTKANQSRVRLERLLSRTDFDFR